MTKLKIYNGEEVLEKGRPEEEAHRARAARGRQARGPVRISTRFIMKALDTALTRNNGSIHPINVREALIGMVKEADTAEDTKKQYLEFLQDTLHKVYLEMLEKDITKAFVYSQGQADAVPQLSRPRRGLRHQDQGQGPVTRDEMQPDEAFLKSIEEQIAIIGPAADGFRQEVIALLGRDPARREDRLRLLRAAEGGDREEADELGPRHQPDHHQGAHPTTSSSSTIRAMETRGMRATTRTASTRS